MWRALIQLPSQLSAITSLLREQNSLLRELIAATTGRSAQTLRTPLEANGMPPRRQPPRTARDVFRVTPEERAAQRHAEEERRVAPWRSEGMTEPPTPAMIEPPIPQAPESARMVPPSASATAAAAATPNPTPSRSS